MASRSIKNRPDVKKKSPVAGILAVVTVICAFVAAGAFGIWALGESWLEGLPEYENADQYNTARKTEVYASDDTTLLAEFFIENREPVEIGQISPYVLEGTVATEDERFYEHGGFDLWGIARAAVVNLTGSSREGASTITQQFVRNTVLSDEANDISFKRKVREMYISMKLEEIYSKDQILLMYLNTINYGSGSYGIEAASQRYFSKSALDLTLVEAATLIGIPQSPTYNNPIDYPDASLARRNVVLNRMLTNGYITQAEYDEAVAQPLELNPSEPTSDGIYLYPYFTSYVRDTLLKTYSPAEVFKGGMRVTTTIDPTAQAYAEQAARNKESQLSDNFEVALTAVDPETGFIKAMVGGKDYYASQYNLATQAQRQPGSSFKTFTLIKALEEGISPQTMINCSTSVKVGNDTFSNINHVNYGTRSLASAFAVSSNTGFIRLAQAVGPENIAELGKRMGITESTLNPYLALTLGASDVTVTEMAEAYATIADGGVQHDAVSIMRILDRNGNVLVDNSVDNNGTQAITPEVAYAATQVMEGVLQYGGTGTDAALASGQPAAGKTGTSENYRDSWFCGFTPQMSVAIWLGDRRGADEGAENVPPDVTASSVFSEFMNAYLDGKPIVQFKTAPAPPYKAYSDTKLGIGGSSSSSDDEKSDKDKEPSSNNEGTNGNNGTGGNGGTTDPSTDPGTDPGTDPSPAPEPDPTPTPPTPDPEPTPDPGGGGGTPTPPASLASSPLALRNDWFSELFLGNGISFRTIHLQTA